MFKVGQILKAPSGRYMHVLSMVSNVDCQVMLLTGRAAGRTGYIDVSRAQAKSYTLIGNNYTPLERPTAKAMPEQRGCRKEDC